MVLKDSELSSPLFDYFIFKSHHAGLSQMLYFVPLVGDKICTPDAGRCLLPFRGRRSLLLSIVEIPAFDFLLIVDRWWKARWQRANCAICKLIFIGYLQEYLPKVTHVPVSCFGLILHESLPTFRVLGLFPVDEKQVDYDLVIHHVSNLYGFENHRRYQVRGYNVVLLGWWK